MAKQGKKTVAPAATATASKKSRTAPAADSDSRPMNKQTFVARLAETTYEKPSGEVESIFGSKAQARRALEAMLEEMVRSVEHGGKGVSFTGYFAVKTKRRAARKGVKVPSRNRGDFEVRDIPAKIVPRLTPGVRLKTAAAAK